MKDLIRVLLEIFGPPAIGATTLLFYFNLSSDPHMDIEINLGSVIAFLFMGWSIAGIPSLFYMLLMEREITRGAHPNTWQHIFSSCLLGVLAGVALASFFSITHAYGGPNEWLGTPEFWLIVTADGLWTGFVMGLLIKGLTYWGERRSRLATGQTGIGP